jgi:hypothetical protein
MTTPPALRKGVDVYETHACNVDNFNIPPAWLWLGVLGLDGSDSTWLSAVVIAATAIVMVLLFKGRPWSHGAIALAAIISPSVMMGVERGNLDLLILVLVGSAALIYDEKEIGRAYGAIAVLFLTGQRHRPRRVDGVARDVIRAPKTGASNHALRTQRL